MRRKLTPDEAFSTSLYAIEPQPADVLPNGASIKTIGFLNEEQSHELAELTIASLKRGDEPKEVEQVIKDFLRELPDGLLAKHGWQVDQLAELLTIAAILAKLCHDRRPHHG